MSPKNDDKRFEEIAPPTLSFSKKDDETSKEVAPERLPRNQDDTNFEEMAPPQYDGNTFVETAPKFQSKKDDKTFEEFAPTPLPSNDDSKGFIFLEPSPPDLEFAPLEESAPTSKEDDKTFEEIAPTSSALNVSDKTFEEFAPTFFPSNQEDEFGEMAPPEPKTQGDDFKYTNQDDKRKSKIEDDRKVVITPLVSSPHKDVPKEKCGNKMAYDVCSAEFVKRGVCLSDGKFDFNENCQQYCEFCVPDLQD